MDSSKYQDKRYIKFDTFMSWNGLRQCLVNTFCYMEGGDNKLMILLLILLLYVDELLIVGSSIHVIKLKEYPKKEIDIKNLRATS